MNIKTKKSIAAILSMAVICNSVGFIGSSLNSTLGNNSYVCAAEQGVSSGNTGGKYYITDYENGYTLYFAPNKEKNTAAIEGCITYRDSVCINMPYSVNCDNNEYIVAEIADNAFSGQNCLKDIINGSQIVKIGDNAFENCSQLENVNFLDYVEEIGKSAFQNCSQLLKSGTLHTSYLKKLGERAFMNCGISKLDMNNSKVDMISAEAFSGCNNLTYAKLSESGVTINNEAFADCTSLVYIYIPDSFKFIRARAFKNDVNLTTVLMPSKLQEIGNEAFMNCESMRYIVFKNPYTTFSGIYNAGWKSINKKNKDFIVWGNGSCNTAAAFASRNGFTYKDINNASLENVLDNNNKLKSDIKKNVWSLSNTGMFWGKNLGYGKYAYIDNNRTFDGICYGLSSVSVLSQNGYFDINKYRNELDLNRYTSSSDNVTLNKLGTTTDKKGNIIFSDKCKQFVTKIQRSQFSITDISLDNSNEFIKYAEYITYGADKAVLCVNTDWGHAIVCEGLEYKNIRSKYSDYWNKKCSGYDARILIYDVNTNDFDDSHCIYINTNNGDWYIPCKNIRGTKHGLSMKFRPGSILGNHDLKTAEDIDSYIGEMIVSLN